MTKKRKHLIYDIATISLAIVSVVLILMDYSNDLEGWQLILSRCLWGFFVLDFAVRLARASDKRIFFRRCYSDLLAILPFHGIFLFSAPARVIRILKCLNMLRIFAFLCRPLRKVTRFMNTNGFKYVLFITVLTILTGGIMIHYVEGMSLDDGIWWAFVTAATVGYGDISPSSFAGRLIAMVLMLVGIGLIGSVTSTLTSYFFQRSANNVRDNTLKMIQQRLDHFDELSEADVEDICRILKSLKGRERKR